MTPAELLDKLGIAFQEKANRLSLCCPFHDDRSPSAAFYKDSNRFWCFACSLSLDMVGFYAKYQGTLRSVAEAELGIQADEGDQEERRRLADRCRREIDQDFKRTKRNWRQAAEREEEGEKLVWRMETGQLQKVQFYREWAQWKEREIEQKGTDLE